MRHLSEQQRASMIRSHTFFKEKFKVSGELEKLKARLVAGGNLVDMSMLGDVYSPTGKLEALLLIHAIAAQFGFASTAMDVPGAYLNTRLPESQRIAMRLGPEEVEALLVIKPEWAQYVRADGSMVVMILGGLYGLPQAAQLWYDKLTTTLVRLGYSTTQMDKSCFVKFNSSGHRSIVLVHVDDLYHVFSTTIFQTDLQNALAKEYGPPVVQQGNTGIYLGIEYSYDRVRKSVDLTMMKFVNKVLDDHPNLKERSMPCTEAFTRSDPDSPSCSMKEYASGVMTLYYLALRTRPDLLVYCAFMSSRIHDCRDDDMKKLRHLLGYLLKTRTRGIVLKCQGTRLHFAIDASYNVHENHRSHSGMHVTLGGDDQPAQGYGGPIIVKSHVQRLTAASSCEAEMIAVMQYHMYFTVMRSLMMDFGYDQDQPSIVLQDNEAAVLIMSQGKTQQASSRHMGMRIARINELTLDDVITFVHCPTGIMPADPPSKPMHAGADEVKLKRLTNCPR